MSAPAFSRCRERWPPAWGRMLPWRFLSARSRSDRSPSVLPRVAAGCQPAADPMAMSKPPLGRSRATLPARCSGLADVLACGGVAAALADVAVSVVPPRIGGAGARRSNHWRRWRASRSSTQAASRAARGWSNAATMVKLIPLAIFVVAGARAMHRANFSQDIQPQHRGIGARLHSRPVRVHRHGDVTGRERRGGESSAQHSARAGDGAGVGDSVVHRHSSRSRRGFWDPRWHIPRCRWPMRWRG